MLHVWGYTSFRMFCQHFDEWDSGDSQGSYILCFECILVLKCSANILMNENLEIWSMWQTVKKESNIYLNTTFRGRRRIVEWSWGLEDFTTKLDLWAFFFHYHQLSLDSFLYACLMLQLPWLVNYRLSGNSIN